MSEAPNAKPGFIFDLDGTLADTMPAHFRAWTITGERYGLSFPENRFYKMGGVPTRKIAAMLIAEAGKELDPLAVTAFKEQVFLDSLDAPGAIQPIAAVLDIARAKRSEGLLAIASGGSRRLVQRTLNILNIASWFPVVVTQEDTKLHKPEPDVFLEAARQLGVDPSLCTVYEDTDLGIEAARRAKMQWVDVRPLYERPLIVG
ncbi:MAG TPA: HAD-IA family hydrolase [Polyangiaceae bacterium]|jgi:HAD superfamily hydrolase (TIGR01509 family)